MSKSKPKFYERVEGEPPTLSQESRDMIAFTRTLKIGDRVKFTAKRMNETIARYPTDDLEGQGTLVQIYLYGGMRIALEGRDQTVFIRPFGRVITKL